MQEPKVFQFDPADYGTDYKTIKAIYQSGFVAYLGKEVAIEYTYEWQLPLLFSKIPNVRPEDLPKEVKVEPNKWDKPLAIAAIPLVIWFFYWLFFC